MIKQTNDFKIPIPKYINVFLRPIFIELEKENNSVKNAWKCSKVKSLLKGTSVKKESKIE